MIATVMHYLTMGILSDKCSILVIASLWEHHTVYVLSWLLFLSLLGQNTWYLK